MAIAEVLWAFFPFYLRASFEFLSFPVMTTVAIDGNRCGVETRGHSFAGVCFLDFRILLCLPCLILFEPGEYLFESVFTEVFSCLFYPCTYSVGSFYCLSAVALGMSYGIRFHKHFSQLRFKHLD